MFLDEELNKVYEENKEDVKVCSLKLLDIMTQRVSTDVPAEQFINTLKQIDFSWRLFCKTHPQFSVDGFRSYIKKCDVDGKLITVLKW